jgi:hypothetical protein
VAAPGVAVSLGPSIDRVAINALPEAPIDI